jgi:hypothetical protein
MRAERREAFGQFRLTVYRSFTDAITPELRNDAKFLKWVRLPYALRYLDLLCAPSRAHHRIICDVVVIVLFPALLLRFLHMCAALEVNFVSK